MIIGLDITTTVERFAEMRDQMIPRVALGRLHDRDEVHWMSIAARPDRDVQVKLLKGLGQDKNIIALYEAIHAIKQTTNHKEINDTGAVMRYAKSISKKLERERQRQANQGKSTPRATRVVLTMFTDGELPAGQSMPEAGLWPTDLDVWVWGVEKQYEARLRQWITTTLGLPEAQLHIVLRSEWQLDVEKTFGPRIDRPSINVGLLKRLGVS